MMNVLVTGSKGQLGRCLQDAAKAIPNLQFVFTDKEELDITSKGAVSEYFQSHEFDYCINCAAYTAVDKAESEQDKAFLINAEAVRILAQACLLSDCIFIHISTDFVFDGEKRTPYTEGDIPNPINIYGASKFKGEQYVQQILKKYFMIRTSWVYSEYGHNFVKTMLRLAKEKNEISVVNDQIGSPTYAGDLAKLILKIIYRESNTYGIYHFSNVGSISWYDFAKEIYRVSHLKTKVIPIASKDYTQVANRPVFSILATDKVNQLMPGSGFLCDWKSSLLKAIKRIR
ncbi:MAG: dTDP-4-dehydrorhamnose reductase [Eudoraea sp.]|nr:dTDP-4-dehydrorhamnose reductase [Eudoraea sp.]